jgi:diguanylate cyclase (GGDEF)-like protein
MSTDPVDPTPDAEAPPWRPELTEAIYTLLYRDDLGLDRLVSEVDELARREGTAVYAELLYLLAHIRFEADDAEHHWKEVIAHRATMEEGLGSEVDLSVALVSYFVQVNRQLQNPKLIELKVFEETQASAYRDELTGLHNFRFFQEYLNWEVHRCERHGGSFSIAMGDIDNFKDYNDRFGHNQGNATLQMVARTLVDAGREEDVVARYGGEEFVLIMPETGKDAAAHAADRVREAVGDLELSAEDPLHRVTISLGVANYPVDAESPDNLIRCADRAMYIAKARGKNQVQLYGANRRAHRRIDAVIDGEYRVFEKEVGTFSTLDISERSLRVSMSREVSEGALLEFTLMLPEHGQKVSAVGRVLRSQQLEGGEHQLAINIVDISGRAHLILKRYLRDQAPDATPPAEP